MKKSLIVSALVLLSVSTLGHASSLSSMSKKHVMDAFQDKTMVTASLTTDHDGKLVENAFTGYFGKDGKAEGKMAQKPEKEQQSDKGTWMVKLNGTFCATWENWNEKKPMCFFVYDLKNSYVFVNTETKKLETVVVKDNVKEGNKVS